ncbi:MAG: pyridoxal phosphate-dependent aminotransferase [candidate division Zixibacteria bacterium]|jgi:aspartate/methionine/tyrosine aminotransferase|nr:pyridoxal phosphate-dependent aminotransferase [candidate division Zixibacteria bacterium]
MKYSERIRRLESEGAFAVLARAKQMEREGKSIIHLQIGEPDFDTPANITEAAYKALRNGHTHYAPSGGIPEAREAIADEVRRTRKVNVSAENVIVMPGCKPVIFAAIMALVEEGDEVIVPNPGYPTYRSVTRFLGAEPVPVPLREEHDFRFNLDEVRALITPRTRVIILNSPGNPTGGVLTESDLEGVFALAKKHDLWIVTDEIYSRLVYEGEFKSILSVPGALERTIAVDGMSKTYAMTGWRLGYGIMPKQLADYFFTFAINNFSSTATFSQYAMVEALTGPQDGVDQMIEQFRRRREVIVDGLNAIDGITCLKPQGAFYVFPNITGTGLSSKEFAEVMLEQAGVACLSGTAFGQYGEGYVRFSYANSIENIEEALRRIKKTLAAVKV